MIDIPFLDSFVSTKHHTMLTDKVKVTTAKLTFCMPVKMRLSLNIMFLHLSNVIRNYSQISSRTVPVMTKLSSFSDRLSWSVTARNQVTILLTTFASWKVNCKLYSKFAWPIRVHEKQYPLVWYVLIKNLINLSSWFLWGEIEQSYKQKIAI